MSCPGCPIYPGLTFRAWFWPLPNLRAVEVPCVTHDACLSFSRSNLQRGSVENAMLAHISHFLLLSPILNIASVCELALCRKTAECLPFILSKENRHWAPLRQSSKPILFLDVCHSNPVEICLPPLGAEHIHLPPEQVLESRVGMGSWVQGQMRMTALALCPGLVREALQGDSCGRVAASDSVLCSAPLTRPMGASFTMEYFPAESRYIPKCWPSYSAKWSSCPPGKRGVSP